MLCALSAALSGLALAENWTGKLVDSACYDQQKQQEEKEQPKEAKTCTPTSSTTTFALVVATQAFKLDDAGNAKAVEALKSRADRTADPGKTTAAEMMAKVSGTKMDEILKVDSVEVQ